MSVFSCGTFGDGRNSLVLAPCMISFVFIATCGNTFRHVFLLQNSHNMEDKSLVIVINKQDLVKTHTIQNDYQGSASRSDSNGHSSGTISVSLKNGALTPVVFTSLTEGEGLPDLIKELTFAVKSLCGDPLTHSPTYTQSRHRNHLINCLNYLEEAESTLMTDMVLTAESLRLSCGELGQISGQISTEDILDVVFKDFCIGK